jgi:hypothetical protein
MYTESDAPMTNLGGFSDEALQLFQLAASERGYDEFAEGGDTYDFTRCVRANGTFYGTRGKCKSGSEAGAKEITAKPAKPVTRDEKVNALRDKVSVLKASGDKKKLAAARGDLQGQERMRKIESTAKKEGKTPDDVIRERNAAADKKTKARLSEKYPQLASGANKGGDAKPARKPRATSAEAKTAWQEAEKGVIAAKVKFRAAEKETKGDQSVEARQRRLEASSELDKAERAAMKVRDRFFAVKKREDRAGMTPEQRKLEREADKLTKGG